MSQRVTRVSISLFSHSIAVLTHIPSFSFFPGSHSQSFRSEYGGSSRAEGTVTFYKVFLCHCFLLLFLLGNMTPRMDLWRNTLRLIINIINDVFAASEGTVVL